MSKSSQAKERLKNSQENKNQAVNVKPKSKKYYAKAGEVWHVNDKKTRGHKSLITKRRKSDYEMVEHIPITHDDETRKKRNILLSENPEKEKKDEPCYSLPKVQKTHYSKLGKKRDDIRITNPNDKAIIRQIKKKSKQK